MTKKRDCNVVGIIPARFASSRFPGKLLVKIHDKTIIQHTYENARKSNHFDELIVATDDQRIYDHVLAFGGKVTMTPQCATGTDRLAYVVENETRLQEAEMIINIQGDEPCLDPKAIQAIIEALRQDCDSVMSTAVAKIHCEEEAHNPSEVKCVLDMKGNALYFSRSLIPGNGQLKYRKEVTYYKHIGIYAFKPDFLLHYAKLPQTPLQIAEDLEQLKVLEHGYKIKTAIVNTVNVGVNTPEDIKKVELELCKQNLFLSPEVCAPLLAKD